GHRPPAPPLQRRADGPDRWREAPRGRPDAAGSDRPTRPEGARRGAGQRLRLGRDAAAASRASAVLLCAAAQEGRRRQPAQRLLGSGGGGGRESKWEDEEDPPAVSTLVVAVRRPKQKDKKVYAFEGWDGLEARSQTRRAALAQRWYRKRFGIETSYRQMRQAS